MILCASVTPLQQPQEQRIDALVCHERLLSSADVGGSGQSLQLVKLWHLQCVGLVPYLGTVATSVTVTITFLHPPLVCLDPESSGILQHPAQEQLSEGLRALET